MLHFSEQSRNEPGAGGAVAQGTSPGGAAPPASRLSYGSCSSTSEGCGGGASQVRWQNAAQRPSTAAQILAGLGYMTLPPEAS